MIRQDPTDETGNTTPTPIGEDWLTHPGESIYAAGIKQDQANLNAKQAAAGTKAGAAVNKAAASGSSTTPAITPAGAQAPPTNPNLTNNGQPTTAYLQTIDQSDVGLGMADLSEFGLDPTMSAQAVAWYKQEETNGVDANQMQQDMYQQSWFKQAFPGIAAQIKNGAATVMSPQDYMTFKNNVQSFTADLGVPPGFITDADIGNMVAQGWNINTVGERLSGAFAAQAQALAQNPDAVKLLDTWYNIKSPGQLASFMLDPTKATQAVANEMTAAQTGAVAGNAGLNKLDQNTLTSLATHGVTLSTATNAIQNAVAEEGVSEDGVAEEHQAQATQAELVGAQTGGLPSETQQQAQRAVNLAVGGRNAPFRGGGGFAGQGQPGQPTGTGYGAQ
jgi:hypothetical protein